MRVRRVTFWCPHCALSPVPLRACARFPTTSHVMRLRAPQRMLRRLSGHEPKLMGPLAGAHICMPAWLSVCNRARRGRPWIVVPSQNLCSVACGHAAQRASTLQLKALPTGVCHVSSHTLHLYHQTMRLRHCVAASAAGGRVCGPPHSAPSKRCASSLRARARLRWLYVTPQCVCGAARVGGGGCS